MKTLLQQDISAKKWIEDFDECIKQKGLILKRTRREEEEEESGEEEEEKEEEEILKLEGNHSLQKYATGYHILRFVTDNIVSDLIRCQRASNVPRVDEIKKHSLKLVAY